MCVKEKRVCVCAAPVWELLSQPCSVERDAGCSYCGMSLPLQPPQHTHTHTPTNTHTHQHTHPPTHTHIFSFPLHQCSSQRTAKVGWGQGSKTALTGLFQLCSVTLLLDSGTSSFYLSLCGWQQQRSTPGRATLDKVIGAGSQDCSRTLALKALKCIGRRTTTGYNMSVLQTRNRL